MYDTMAEMDLCLQLKGSLEQRLAKVQEKQGLNEARLQVEGKTYQKQEPEGRKGFGFYRRAVGKELHSSSSASRLRCWGYL